MTMAMPTTKTTTTTMSSGTTTTTMTTALAKAATTTTTMTKRTTTTTTTTTTCKANGAPRLQSSTKGASEFFHGGLDGHSDFGSSGERHAGQRR